MAHRILWTWDAWLCDPFSAESYVAEYERLIDFMVEWDYNGLIIWGFIDDRHGGEDAAKAVASYGNSRGVRVMPGIGAGGYGGFVTSRSHRFSIDTLVSEHPELAAVCRHDRAPSNEWFCLYQEKSLQWLREGAAWLADNFEIGGVNIETNEAWNIDVCEHAADATVREPNRLKYAASFSDLAIAVPLIHEEIRRRDPESWVTYATYEPPWWDRQEDLWLLDRIPDDAIAQWNMELSVNTAVPPPVRRNISLVHSGGWSYHLAAEPPIWAFTQRRCFYPDLEQARRFAINQRAMNMDGFALGNVGSPAMPDNEIAYIAHIEFSRSPEMTIDEFSARHIGALYGQKAEPIVKRLILDQAPLHQEIGEMQRAWSRAVLGKPVGALPVASESHLARISDQITLVDRAHEVASGGGRRRLSIIREILDEYRIIAELSRVSSLSREARDWFARRQWSADAT